MSTKEEAKRRLADGKAARIEKGRDLMKYMIEQINEIAPQQCPCGTTRRAFMSPDNQVATIHVVDISKDSKVHYHKKLTEIYFVLEGEGHIELDGERVPLKPMTSILIKPGCRHRAIGKLKIIVIPIPAFDPEDEWFDDCDNGCES